MNNHNHHRKKAPAIIDLSNIKLRKTKKPSNTQPNETFEEEDEDDIHTNNSHSNSIVYRSSNEALITYLPTAKSINKSPPPSRMQSESDLGTFLSQ